LEQIYRHWGWNIINYINCSCQCTSLSYTLQWFCIDTKSIWKWHCYRHWSSDWFNDHIKIPWCTLKLVSVGYVTFNNSCCWFYHGHHSCYCEIYRNEKLSVWKTLKSIKHKKFLCLMDHKVYFNVNNHADVVEGCLLWNCYAVMKTVEMKFPFKQQW